MLFTLKNDLIEAIISKEELEENFHLLDNNAVLISIIDPGSPLLKKEVSSYFKDVLHVQFHDFEENFCQYQVIEDVVAKEIKEFILKNKDEKFVIHCMAGKSRSAGVGCAIECLLKYNGDKYLYQTGHSDIKDHPRYTPNYTVFKKIIN